MTKKMKKIIGSTLVILSVLSFMIAFNACNDDDDNGGNVPVLDQADKEALLFMLEEEKLARDTYMFLLEKWNQAIFLNIMTSEQSHMDAVSNLLDKYSVSYEILDHGEFVNSELQALYEDLTGQGQLTIQDGMAVGATIEDLDIVDLEEFIQATENNQLIDVFSSLQCGSRNHLRSFVSNLELIGGEYTPQFLTQEWYEEILDAPMEQCGI